MISGQMCSDYSAKFTCPGCGSPVEMPEGTISIKCPYCALTMRIGSPGRILKYYYESPLDDFALKFSVERYLKDKGLPLKFSRVASKLYYLPFYRYRGMTYALLTEKICTKEEEADFDKTPLPSKFAIQPRCRHFDLTIPAFSEESFGLDSLGIRPEVMPLTVFTDETVFADSIPVEMTFSLKEAKEQALAMFAFNLGFISVNKECLISEIIGERISIVYYPIWAYGIVSDKTEDTLFIDGLSKRVINEIPGIFEYFPKGQKECPGDILRPIAHRCPNCGHDLPTSESSLTYYCDNCGKMFVITDDSYVSMPVKTARYEASLGTVPFWRFPFKACDNFKTVGQYAKILTGEIPLIAKAKADLPFYLYIPAFKEADLDLLTQRSLRLTRIQPILELNSQNGFTFSVETVLTEHDARNLAQFYWLAIRSKYRYLNDAKYDFAENKTGAGELVWLTMATEQSTKRAFSVSGMP